MNMKVDCRVTKPSSNELSAMVNINYTKNLNKFK